MAFEIKVLDKRGDDPEDLRPGGGAGAGAAAPGGKIQIRGEDLVEDRYHRLRLIKWWASLVPRIP